MNEKQSMETIKKEFIIDATGKSKEEVYGAAFAKLKKVVYNEVEGVILHMEPLEVYTLEEEEESFTEKFLWLFMPRTKYKFYMKLKIVVLIKVIHI